MSPFPAGVVRLMAATMSSRICRECVGEGGRQGGKATPYLVEAAVHEFIRRADSSPPIPEKHPVQLLLKHALVHPGKGIGAVLPPVLRLRSKEFE